MGDKKSLLKMDGYYVYHIGFPGMSLDQGYIGITRDINRRINEHLSNANTGKEGTLYNNIRVQGPDKLVYNVLNKSGEPIPKSKAMGIERSLRRKSNVGWNQKPGGNGSLPFSSKAVWKYINNLSL